MTRLFFLAALLVATLCPAIALAQFVTPSENLVIDGVPPIPEELADRVKAFGSFPSATLAAWRPEKGGMLVHARNRNAVQLFSVSQPGARLELLTDFEDDVVFASFAPAVSDASERADAIVFLRGREGDEVFQLFRMNLATRESAAISDGMERATPPTWNRKGDRIVYSTSTVDRKSGEGEPDRSAVSRIVLVDPLMPASAKTLGRFSGRSFSAFRFSPDDRTLLMRETFAANESMLWLLDIETAAMRRLDLPHGREPVSYTAAEFSPDGKRIFAISDRDHEFRRLVAIDITNGKEEVLAPQLKFDVTEFAVSEAAKRIALLTNEEGSSVLRMLELDGFKELPRPSLFPGQISGLRWNAGGGEEPGDGNMLAFNMVSARSPGAVFALNIESGRLIRWTSNPVRGVNLRDFVEPSVVKWKSFDGLPLTGFLYQPDPAKFSGKRPVVINIHGGPESQAQPGFQGRSNYLINELGIALIYPNVRGSSGFGKAFMAMDNGRKREDAVKDIGALFEWIRQQPELDASRVLVMGASYGGYMSLAVAAHYPDQIAGAINAAGISRFVTFLARTESYRGDMRRAEYGDERDSGMRDYLEKISPLNNAGKIRKPLMVVHGMNDPRVPVAEAEQIVAQLKKQKTPVWYLMARDEGHGFSRSGNADYLFYAQVMFMQQTLLRQADDGAE